LSLQTLSALPSAVLLTGVSLFSQAVGFVYRVALARMVGSQVMGLYQLVMPVMSVLMSLTAVGFTVACSNLTARYHALGDRLGTSQVARQCVAGFLTAFAVTSAVTLPLSDFISVRFLGDARTRLGLVLLLPCVLLTGLENIHKHSFYGAGNVFPPAACEICEQLIRAGAVLGLLWRFLPQNPERTVGLIVCGMILCEVFSAVTLTLLRRRSWAGSGGPGIQRSILRRRVWEIAVPIGWTSLLGNLMGCATSVMIPQRLVYAGADVPEAMAAFGVMCGMTTPMLALPLCCVSALGLVLVPRLARCAALGRPDLARVLVGQALRAVSALVFPACALLCAQASVLGRLLFREPSAGSYALPLAAGVAAAAIEAVLASCLNGLGRQTVGARNSLLCGAFQLGVTWWRMGLPGVGLRGYVEGFVLSSLLGAGLNGWSVARAIGLRAQWFRWFTAPGLGAVLAGLCVRLLLPILTRAGLSQAAACLWGLGFGCLLYLAALAAMGECPFPGKTRGAN